MALQAGKLRERVTIQTVTRTSDGGGGFTEAWANTATVWARVEPLTGREAFEAMQVASTMSHRVVIRKRTVTPQQRVIWKGKTLRINAVRPDEIDEAVELYCQEEDI